MNTSKYILILLSIVSISVSSCHKSVEERNREAATIINGDQAMYSFKDIATLYTEDTKKIMKNNCPYTAQV